MGGTRIRIDPTQVEGVASAFDSGRDAIDGQVKTLAGKITDLQGNWEGSAQMNFSQEWETYKRTMDQIAPLLEKISTELKGIATRFREADQAR